MIVFPAISECSSADKTEMTAQCPLHDTIHREKGQRKQALKKFSISETKRAVWKEYKDLCLLENFQWKQETQRKFCMDSNVKKTTKKQAHASPHGMKTYSEL